MVRRHSGDDHLRNVDWKPAVSDNLKNQYTDEQLKKMSNDELARLGTELDGVTVVLAFVVVLLRTFKSKFTPAQATAAVVVSYYWHFVDVVWIGLWITIYFIQ